jgi:hypothetical protein
MGIRSDALTTPATDCNRLKISGAPGVFDTSILSMLIVLVTPSFKSFGKCSDFTIIAAISSGLDFNSKFIIVVLFGTTTISVLVTCV